MSQSIEHDPFTPHAISYANLVATGKAQGIDIRPEAQGGHVRIGDILLIRMGWVDRYMNASDEERSMAARRGFGEHGAGAARGVGEGGKTVEVSPDAEKQTWAGIQGNDGDLRRWIHDGYFAAIGGDTPSLEVWPKQGGKAWEIRILESLRILILCISDLECRSISPRIDSSALGDATR